MSRTRSIVLLVGALALMAAVLYLGYRSRPAPAPRVPVAELPGLAWLPAEASLVGGVNLEELRGQAWLFALVERATGDVQEEADYRAFVEATGFDYRRDLDRVWLARLPGEGGADSAGVAEGRFQPEKIRAYAQAGAVQQYAEFTVQEVPLRAQKEGPRRFAFAFLDDSHLAFGSSARRVEQVIDCWLGRASAIAADETRTRELHSAAAGRQAWVVDAGGEWMELLPGNEEDRAALAAAITQVAAGLSVDEQGLGLAAEARCRDASQAKRLRDNLGLMIVLAQLALSRDTDATAQLLRTALANLALTQRERSVRAHLTLSPDVLGQLLAEPPAPAADQP